MRGVIFFSFRNEQRAGGGGAVRLFFLLLFFPCSADHEQDWPPCKVVVFGLATNVLNVRNNNNNNNNSPNKEEIIAFETTVYLLTTRLHPVLRLQVSIRNPILQ